MSEVMNVGVMNVGQSSLCQLQGPDKHGVVTSGACWLVTNAPLGNLDAPTDRFSYPRLENTGNMGKFCLACCIAPSRDFRSRSLPDPEKSKLLKLCKFCKNWCRFAIDNVGMQTFGNFPRAVM